MTVLLTDNLIQNTIRMARQTGKRFELTDSVQKGLRIRISKTSVMWYLACRNRAGESRKYALANYHGVDINEARKLAYITMNKVKNSFPIDVHEPLTSQALIKNADTKYRMKVEIKGGTFHTNDCFEVMATLRSGSIPLILTDLPYGGGGTKFAWDKDLDLEKLFSEYRRILTPTGSIVMTAVQPFTYRLCAVAPDLFKYGMVWTKNRATGALLSKHRPMQRHEDVLVFSKGSIGTSQRVGKRRMTYNPVGIQEAGIKVIRERIHEYTGPNSNRVGTVYTAATNLPNTVLYFPKDQHNNIHPTQKPVALFEYLVKTFSNPGDLVLDNCAGSGTTAVACENAGRRWIMVEQNSEFANAAKARIRKHVVERTCERMEAA